MAWTPQDLWQIAAAAQGAPKYAPAHPLYVLLHIIIIFIIKKSRDYSDTITQKTLQGHFTDYRDVAAMQTMDWILTIHWVIHYTADLTY